MVNWWFGLVFRIFWDPLMKGIVTSGYPDSNPKPPGPKPRIANSLIVNDGISTTNLNWWTPDFSINSMMMMMMMMMIY